MPMSRCEDVIERISVVIDGAAGLFATLRFRAHLAMCESCRRYYWQMVRVRHAAAVVRPDDLPEDFEEIMGFVRSVIRSPTAPSTNSEETS